jgi:hypothetical protein
LATIKVALQQMANSGGASCAGQIDSESENKDVSAVVRWVPSGDAGFWDVTCGGN